MEENNPNKYNFFLKGANAKAVLLIHGITGTPSEMRYLGKGLQKAGYTVLCNTLPRHCSSLGVLKKVTWQEIHAACVKDFKRLKEDYQQVFVGGLSMGALMSIHLAHEFSGEISGVFALAPTLFYDGWSLHWGKVFLEIFWQVPYLRNRVNIRESWPYGLKDENIRQNIERFYKNADSKEYDDKVLLFGSPFFPLANLYQHHLLTNIVKKELSSVHTPILIIHAKEDDMTSIKNAQYVYGHIASAQKKLVILNDSYHMITIDKDKDLVIQEVVDFLGHCA